MTESIEDTSLSNNDDDETLVDENELNQFTATLDQLTPVIPDTVTKFYMRQCGLQTDDERVVKLLSVSVQKFMSDIVNDCYQLHKLREKSTNRPATAAAALPTTTATTQAAVTEPAVTTAATTTTTTTTTDSSANAANAKKPVTSTNQTLTLNDLSHVLGEYGINVKKTFYYT
ncbi:unnamed protein product [Adineta steineri]|uniref:Transcription initiation factor TFIID subunit 10 n=1 Tax=Adineta steineri TaxID=433720 RepID=A0A815F6F6_9BILA|nr:unnamed protein product [Adineta steineri]CAF3701024.1 unnamed protein product [Adineta steineri]